MHAVRRRMLTGAVAAALVVGGAVLAPQAAQADGSNIVFSHGLGGSTYIHVVGTGTLVKKWDSSHGHTGEPWLNYCGFRTKVFGTLSTGASWSHITALNASCIPIGFANYGNVNLRFKNNTNFIAQAYHDGAWTPGLPRVGVHA